MPSTDAAEAFAGYLDELERVCQAAPPEPWELDSSELYVLGHAARPLFVLETDDGGDSTTAAVAAGRFVVAARHALPRLIAEVRRITELEQLHEERVRVFMRMAGPVCFDCNAKRVGTKCADCLGELWEDENGVRHAEKVQR